MKTYQHAELLHREIDIKSETLLYVISNGSRSDMEVWRGLELMRFFNGVQVGQDRMRELAAVNQLSSNEELNIFK